MGKRSHGPQLLAAIEHNDQTKVHEILAQQVRAREKIRELCVSFVRRMASETYDVPLLSASSLGDPGIVNYMVNTHHVDVNHVIREPSGRTVKFKSALLVAVRRGLYDTVDALLTVHADPNVQDHKGRSALHHATRKADFRMAKMLLARGAQPSLADMADNTPLHVAAIFGHVELCKVLIHYGADLYRPGQLGALPIHVAAREGHCALLRMFVAREVNPNIRVPCYEGREQAPIHVAAQEGHHEVVRELVDRLGADYALADSEGETPLHAIVLHEYDPLGMKNKDDYNETVKVLVRAGADVNQQNGRGETALHLAAANQFHKVVELLLQAGADPTVEDNARDRAIDRVPPDDVVSAQIIRQVMSHRERYMSDALEMQARGFSTSFSQVKSSSSVDFGSRDLLSSRGRASSTLGLLDPEYLRPVDVSENQPYVNDVGDAKRRDRSLPPGLTADSGPRMSAFTDVTSRSSLNTSLASELAQQMKERQTDKHPDKRRKKRADRSSSEDGSRIYNTRHDPRGDSLSSRRTQDTRTDSLSSRRTQESRTDSFTTDKSRTTSYTSATTENTVQVNDDDDDDDSFFDDESFETFSEATYDPDPLRASDTHAPLNTSSQRQTGAVFPGKATREPEPFVAPVAKAPRPPLPPDHPENPRLDDWVREQADLKHKQQQQQATGNWEIVEPSPGNTVIRMIPFSKPGDKPSVAVPPAAPANLQKDIHMEDNKNLVYTYTDTESVGSYSTLSYLPNDSPPSEDSGPDTGHYTARLFNAGPKAAPRSSKSEEVPITKPKKPEKPVITTAFMPVNPEKSHSSQEAALPSPKPKPVIKPKPPVAPPTVVVPPVPPISPRQHKPPHIASPRVASPAQIPSPSTLHPPVASPRIASPISTMSSESTASSRPQKRNRNKGVMKLEAAPEKPQTPPVLPPEQVKEEPLPSQSTQETPVAKPEPPAPAPRTDRLASAATKQENHPAPAPRKEHPPVQQKHEPPAPAPRTATMNGPVDHDMYGYAQIKKSNQPTRVPEQVSAEQNSTKPNLPNAVNGVPGPPPTKPGPKPQTPEESSEEETESSEEEESEEEDAGQVIPIGSPEQRRVRMNPQLVQPSQQQQGTPVRTIAYACNNPGVDVVGGNSSGIFVSSVLPGGPAQTAGLTQGDQILTVNDKSLAGFTHEEVARLLGSLSGDIKFTVRAKPNVFSELLKGGEVGDSFHVRANFTYRAERTEHVSVKPGDVFQVSDTLPRGHAGFWRASTLTGTSGLIPNEHRAEQLSLEEPLQRGGLARSRRTKSVDRLAAADKLKAGRGVTGYEWVDLRKSPWPRPVVLLGLFSDSVIKELVGDSPQIYTCPPVVVENFYAKEHEERVNTAVLNSIARDQARHALVILTPPAINFLKTQSDLNPIVLYLSPPNKNVIKHIRDTLAPNYDKKASFLLKEASDFEKQFSSLFTATVPYASDDSWFTLLKDTVQRLQDTPHWAPVQRHLADDDDYVASQPINAKLNKSLDDMALPPKSILKTSNSDLRQPRQSRPTQRQQSAAPEAENATKPSLATSRLGRLHSTPGLIENHNGPVAGNQEPSGKPPPAPRDLKATIAAQQKQGLNSHTGRETAL